MPNGVAYGPFTQYLQRLGIGATGGGPAGGYLRSLYDPLQSLYAQEQIYAPLMGSTPGGWGDYLGEGYTGVPRTMYDRARQILRQLMATPYEKRAEMGLTWEPTYPEGGGEGREVSQSSQQALLQQALAPIWGYGGAGRFQQRLPVEEQIWLQRKAEGEGKSFLEWLRDKYNLARFV